MAFEGTGAGGKSLALPTQGAGQKPDPLIQPALANAMRMNKPLTPGGYLAQLSPGGTKAGVGGDTGPESPIGARPAMQAPGAAFQATATEAPAPAAAAPVEKNDYQKSLERNGIYTKRSLDMDALNRVRHEQIAKHQAELKTRAF